MLSRDAAVQVGQRLVVRELGDLGHDRAQDIGDLTHGAEEVAKRCAVHAGRAAPRRRVLEQQALGRADRFLRRQEGEGQVVAALEVTLLRLERGPPLVVDQIGDRIGERAGRILLRRRAQRLKVQAPARAQAAQGVVQLRPRGDQAGVRGASQIWAAEGEGLLETAVLVQDQARPDQRDPGQVIEEARGLGAVFPEIEQGRPPPSKSGVTCG